MASEPPPHNQKQGHRCSRRCLPPAPRKIFDRRAAMRRNNGKGPKLELKLNLFVPTTSRRLGAEELSSPNGSMSSSSLSSPPSSCVSSCSNSPEATTMVLAGCPRCLMYVMLSQADPRCPKCKNAVLLDFLRGTATTTTTTTTTDAADDDNNNNNNNNDDDDDDNSKKTRNN